MVSFLFVMMFFIFSCACLSWESVCGDPHAFHILKVKLQSTEFLNLVILFLRVPSCPLFLSIFLC